MRRANGLWMSALGAGMKEQAMIPLHLQVGIWAMKNGVTFRPRVQEGIRLFEVDAAP